MSDERKRLTKRVVDAAKPLAKAYILWDSDLAGFGLRVSPSGAKAYIASYRVGVGRGAKQRRVSIGRSSAMTCEAARREATVYIAAARTGDDRREEVHFDAASAAKDLTVKEAIELWRAEAAPRNRRNGKKRRQKNIDNDVNRLNAHVVPLIGKRLVSSLTAQDIAKLRDDITEGKTACVVKTKKHGVRRVTGGAGTATRTIRTFKSVLSYCVDR